MAIIFLMLFYLLYTNYLRFWSNHVFICSKISSIACVFLKDGSFASKGCLRACVSSPFFCRIRILLTFFSDLNALSGRRMTPMICAYRSEERRVGKECRFRGWRYQYNKKRGKVWIYGDE